MQSLDAELKERSSSAESSGEAKENKPNVLLEVLGSIVVAVIGFYVYKATGLYDAADSVIVHIVIGGGIISWFILNFRVALHQR